MTSQKQEVIITTADHKVSVRLVGEVRVRSARESLVARIEADGYQKPSSHEFILHDTATGAVVSSTVLRANGILSPGRYIAQINVEVIEIYAANALASREYSTDFPAPRANVELTAMEAGRGMYEVNGGARTVESYNKGLLIVVIGVAIIIVLIVLVVVTLQ
jgi:hypothetical protein